MTCIAALMFATAGSANARSDTQPQLSEHGGQQAQPQAPQTPQGAQLSEHGGQQAQAPVTTSQIVGDTPSDRVTPTVVPSTSGSSASTSDDGSDNAPLIIGLSLLTVALLGSGTYAVRRHRVAPGH